MMDTPDGESCTDVADPLQWPDKYGDALYAFAMARLGDRDLAEDLVQETFLAGLAAIDSFRRESSLLTWFMGILRRKIADEFRGRRRNPLQQAVAIKASAGYAFFDRRGKWQLRLRAWRVDPQDVVQSQEFWETLEACMDQLPPTLAAAFRLKQLEGLDAQNVCSALQISSDNLSVRMHRARLLLRTCLDRNWFA
jgi:RNA polymerase sigma-70 factor (ECF subfamily)